MRLINVSDGPAPDPFIDQPCPFASMPLVTHLCRDFHCPSRFGKFSSLLNCVSQRFLHIGMFTHLHSHHCGNSVSMVRCTDSYGINLFFLIKQHTKILITFSLRKFIVSFCGPFIIDITKSIDIFRINADCVIIAHTANSDTGHIQFITWGSIAIASQDIARYNGKSCSCGSFSDKFPSGNRPFFLFVDHVLTPDRILWLISSIFPSTSFCTISIITIYWLILFSAVVISTILALSFFFHFTFLSLLINIPLFFETYGWQRIKQASESY